MAEQTRFEKHIERLRKKIEQHSTKAESIDGQVLLDRLLKKGQQPQ